MRRLFRQSRTLTTTRRSTDACRHLAIIAVVRHGGPMDLTSLQGAHDTAAILWFMHGPYGLDIALAQQLIQAGLTPHDLQVIYHQQFRQDFVDIH